MTPSVATTNGKYLGQIERQPEARKVASSSLEACHHRIHKTGLLTENSYPPKTRCSTWSCPFSRPATPWLPPATADSAPSAAPRSASSLPSGSATLLFACPTVEYRLPETRAYRQACGPG